MKRAVEPEVLAARSMMRRGQQSKQTKYNYLIGKEVLKKL